MRDGRVHGEVRHVGGVGTPDARRRRGRGHGGQGFRRGPGAEMAYRHGALADRGRGGFVRDAAAALGAVALARDAPVHDGGQFILVGDDVLRCAGKYLAQFLDVSTAQDAFAQFQLEHLGPAHLQQPTEIGQGHLVGLAQAPDAAAGRLRLILFPVT